MKIIVNNPANQWRSNIAALTERFNRAISAAANMARSMLEDAARNTIAGAGNFGGRWTDGLHVNIEEGLGNARLWMTHDIPYAGIFETGGVIVGSPLLWIPLSGTDAAGVRASAFSGGLFSAKYPRLSGRPLLFSLSDKKPRYFGIESVTIPKLFHLNDDVISVMANFRSLFEDAWAQG